MSRATRAPFGTLPDGGVVEIVSLGGADGVELRVITYGAAIQAILVPDRDGARADVVLGHDDLAGYLKTRNFFGATIGRYANRIAGGRFEIAGRTIEIAPNDGANALHGGAKGFDTRLWTIEALEDGAEPSVTLTRVSADGEEGFPGKLETRITYRVAGSTVALDFTATSDAPTVINLTNHSFFNLNGVDPVETILDHRLSIDAPTFLPVDAGSIPVGEPRDVEGGAFDFRTPQVIGARIREADEQLILSKGYDHNYCLTGGRTDEPRPVATVEDPKSGRRMELLSDQPGLQFYSGNFLTGAVSGKNGQSYRQGDGLCLEPQTYPDTPNRPDFPSALLSPGETYRHRIRYRFGTA